MSLFMFHMVLHGSCVMESVYFEVCNHLFNYGIFTNFYAQRCFLMICSDASKQIEVEICNYRGFLPYATFGTSEKVALAKNRISKIFILCTQ